MVCAGVAVPPGFDQEHVMYVWFDALTSYLSGVHAMVRISWKGYGNREIK